MATALRINEAISRLHLKTGKRLQFTDIAKIISGPDNYQYNYQKIAGYASGRVRFFDMQYVEMLADILECTPAYLLGLEDANENL